MSSLALASSWPNGFSTTSEQFSAIPLTPSIRTIVLHRARRHREIDEPFGLGADLGLGVLDRLGQLAAVLGAGGDEAQARGELIPLVIDLAAPVVLECLVDVLAKDIV